MRKTYLLYNNEANLLKDILQLIGGDEHLSSLAAKAAKMSQSNFEDLADGIFIKLGNGRLIVEDVIQEVYETHQLENRDI